MSEPTYQVENSTLDALLALFRGQGDKGERLAQFLTACEFRGESPAYVVVREAMEYAELHNPS